MMLGLKPENVHVIFRRGSGCYGLNGADTVTYDAALLSQAVGKPVRVQLTRKDEMAWENYGNAFVIDERAGLDAQGNIVAWDHESWSPALGNRPGPGTPGNVITGSLVGFRARAVHAAIARARAARLQQQQQRRALLCRGTGRWRRQRHGHGARASACWCTTFRRRSGPARCALPRACRTPSRTKASWTNWPRTSRPIRWNIACAICSDERVNDVLKAAAKAANGRRVRRPDPAMRKTGVATGRGVACVAYEGDNGYTGMVVEIEVDQDTGKIAVKRIVRRQRRRTRSRIPTGCAIRSKAARCRA